MTMQELSRLAGVSVSTISKAFSGSREISEPLRNRIFELAKENDCYYKYLKISKYKYVIGVVCPEFQSGYYAQHLDYLEREIKKRGGIMLAAGSNFDENERSEIVSYFAGKLKADGIILYHTSDDDSKYDIPIISLGASDILDSVELSYEQARIDAINHLADNGHRKIAYIGEQLTRECISEFFGAMEKAGININDDYVITTNASRFEAAGYEAMNKLLDLPVPPTAVVAAYDYIAFGAIKAITDRGLKVPEDISIIGRDDVKECDYLSLPLTTITPYSRDLCEIVVNELFDKIENKVTGKPKKIKVSAELIKRGTVSKAPQKK